MSDKQQPEVAAVDVTHEPPVVQGGDDRLACAGRGHDEVAVPIVDRPFGIEFFEHLSLVGLGLHLQTGQRDG